MYAQPALNATIATTATTATIFRKWQLSRFIKR
jgi:hypothetical protein